VEYCCFNGKAFPRFDFTAIFQYGWHVLSYVLVQVTVNAPVVWVKLLRAINGNPDSYSYSCLCECSLSLDLCVPVNCFMFRGSSIKDIHKIWAKIDPLFHPCPLLFTLAQPLTPSPCGRPHLDLDARCTQSAYCASLCPSAHRPRAWFQRSGKVGENQSTRVQKLTKMHKKFWTVLRRLRTTVHKFFFTRFAHRLFVSTLLNLFCHLCF